MDLTSISSPNDDIGDAIEVDSFPKRASQMPLSKAATDRSPKQGIEPATCVKSDYAGLKSLHLITEIQKYIYRLI